ncbi:MAG: diguanylate cyclase [Helicobacteraceae bacterium]|jgi:diguanylate cyclase (GGDEF)-like protein|nr:diguanylate cyclase [Helicobacteraceae bacterium]
MLLRKGVTPSDTASSETSEAANPGDEMGKFGQSVLSGLSKDNLPPFPNYYQLYFEKMLDDCPYEFRKSISDMIETEQNTEDEKRMRMEKQLQDGFAIFKEFLQNVATLFKNVSNMTQISKRRMQEAKGINNPSAVQNLTLALNNDLEKLTSVLNSQALVIKNLYAKSAKIIQEVNSETIYDSRYGIFNKRYLSEQIVAELKQMGKFHHQSTLILAKLSTKIKAKITNDKQLALINRTISKLFMKTSRRSDIVAYFGDGCFAMLLKHTDEQNASRAAARVAEMTSGSHFFIADQEIKLEICIGIATLDIAQDADTAMVRSIDALNKADQDGKVYEIAPKTSEANA